MSELIILGSSIIFGAIIAIILLIATSNKKGTPKAVDKGKEYRKLLGLDPSYKEKVCKNLDIFLLQLLDKPIDFIEEVSLNFYITYEDGCMLKAWNTNKYYSWLTQGELTYNKKVIYKWSFIHPSAEVMYKYKELLESSFVKKEKSPTHTIIDDPTQIINVEDKILLAQYEDLEEEEE